MCNFLRRKDRKNNKDTECFRQSLLKLIYYEEVTNFEKISHLVLTLLSKSQNQVGYFFKLSGLLRNPQLFAYTFQNSTFFENWTSCEQKNQSLIY